MPVALSTIEENYQADFRDMFLDIGSMFWNWIFEGKEQVLLVI